MASNISVFSEDHNRTSPKFRTSSHSEDITVSTPHTSFIRPDQMDLSAISSIASDQSVCQGNSKKDLATALTVLGPSFCEPFQPVSTHEKTKETYTQQELDVLYNSYVQWTYLDACFQKRLHEDERTFMTQSHVLWTENERIRAQCAELDLKIAKAKYLKNLEEMIELHEISPMIAELDSFSKSHETLSKSLDVTRHQLPLDGIYINSDPEAFSQTLTDTLYKSLESTQNLKSKLNLDAKSLEDCVAAAGTLSRNLDEIIENLESTKDLTNVMKLLSIEESSLNIQKMMSKSEI